MKYAVGDQVRKHLTTTYLLFRSWHGGSTTLCSTPRSPAILADEDPVAGGFGRGAQVSRRRRCSKGCC